MILLFDDAKDTWKSLYANASNPKAFSDERYSWELDDKVLILLAWDKYIEHFIPDRDYWVILPSGNEIYPVWSKKFVEDIGILSISALKYLGTLCPNLVVNAIGMRLTYLATEEVEDVEIDKEFLTNMAVIINGK